MTRTPFNPDAAKEVARWLGTRKAPTVPAVPVLTGAAATDPDAWLAARDAGVGASDIGVIMGLSTFSSRYAMWWQKHLHWRLPQNEAMADGHALEDLVAAEFMLRHPELLVHKPEFPLWRHRQHEWALCTPDRLAVQVGIPSVLIGAQGTPEEVRAIREETPRSRTADAEIVPVELKWDASPGWGASGSTDVPEQYRLQVMWQAWIFGASGGWLVNHKPTGRNRYREYWIPVDETVILRAAEAARAFVASLECGVSPDPDGSKATEVMLQEMNAGVVPGTVAAVPPALAEQWARARDDVRAAEAYKREMDNRLREVLGDAERGMHADTGEVFVERRISKRAGYEVGPAVVDSLRRVSDGPGAAGAGVPGADRAGGNDSGAGTPGSQEAGGAAAAADGSPRGGGAGEPRPGDPGEPGGVGGSGGPEGAVTDVVTRCAPAQGIHATPHNGPCLLRGA